MSPNLPASVRDRLKQHADASKQDFNLVLTRYGLERLLYRLSISHHANRFLLKGALAFSLWFDHPHRPTRDADLLGFGPPDVNLLVATFREICAIEVADAIQFDLPSIRASQIREEARYGGVRVEIDATLDRARIKLQIDVGFGDAVTPKPVETHYPVILGDMPSPRLEVYPRETAFAEKLEAIAHLGMANSRMKDYFDLLILTREGALDLPVLEQAIAATFKRRGTQIPQSLPIGLSREFAEDPQKLRQWSAFLGRNRLDAPSLEIVVAELAAYLVTILAEAYKKLA